MTDVRPSPSAPPERATHAASADQSSGSAPAAAHHALYRLLTWSSPGYPTGAFSYSHGLEWAVETGSVTDLQGLLDYATAVLSRGGGWVDAVLFVHAWHATRREVDAQAGLVANASGGNKPPALPKHSDTLAGLDDLAALAAAFRGSSETALESRQQGAAFMDVTRKAWPHPTLDALAQRSATTNTPVAHCIAVAVACAAHDIALEPALHAYMHAVAANLVSAGARLIPLGQTQAQITIARLSPTIATIIEHAFSTPLDDLGTSAPAVEICSLRHETQYTRLFRS